MEAFSDDGKTALTRGYVAADGIDYSSTLSGGTPSGKREIISGFGNAKYTPTDWLTISGGLRYDWYHLDGSTTIYGNQITPIIGYRVTPPLLLPVTAISPEHRLPSRNQYADLRHPVLRALQCGR